MINHFRNFLENNDWGMKRIIFTDYSEQQEIEFIRNRDDYTIKFNEFIDGKYTKNNYPVEKNFFYKKLSDVTENTIYNKKHYKLTSYIKLDTLLSVKFN